MIVPAAYRKLLPGQVLLLLFLFFSSALLAQPGKELRTFILDVNKKPVENATVELKRAKDSVLVKTALTDGSGAALFYPEAGAYFIRAATVQHLPAVSAVINVPENGAAVELTLQPKEARALEDVTVTAQKPFIQRLPDRIVVNVENSIINAGSTALEVLERSPGVIVDGDAISLRGRSGVIIMIDGKASPMSGADLVNYLRSLPSGAVDRIEIITNPSARYDAAGNSGIIDIRLKKDQRLGFNGSVSAGAGQGVYFKSNAGTSFNYRNKKVNVFGNYNYNRREDLSTLIQTRTFLEDGVVTGSDAKDNYAVVKVNGHNIRFGADFFPTNKTVAGFVVNSNMSDIGIRSNNISIASDHRQVRQNYFTSLIGGKNRYRNYVGNVNLKHSFSKKSELTVDADYGTYTSGTYSRVQTDYYQLNGSSSKPQYILDANQGGEIVLRSAKMDYMHNEAGSKWEGGLKSSYVSADNDARFFHILPSGPQLDARKSNHFYYDEYNNAGYINHSREWKQWSIQLGLRGEHTSIRTRQVVHDVRWDSAYFQLFPSAFINYKWKGDQTLGLSIGRRIDRPGYGQLNPFLSFIDVTAYSTGNPQLLPQLTWAYEVIYTIKNQSFGLAYSHTIDPQYPVIARILDVIPDFYIEPGSDSNITVQKSMNLDALNYYSLWGSSQARVTPWWSTVNNLNIFYNHARANIGGTVLNDGKPTVSARTNNSFTLQKGWTAELNANLLTGRRSGYLVSRTRWGMDAGVQKKILKNQGSVRLNVTDIFQTLIPRAIVTYPGRYVEHWHAYRDSRVINLSFNYRFGNSKVQAARSRSTASEEERRRAG